MEILGVMFFLAGVWTYNWYKSGETVHEEDVQPIEKSENKSIKVLQFHAINADGFVCDLDVPGPSWSTEQMTVKMAGASLPKGSSGPELWMNENIAGQLRGILNTAKDIRISGINRSKDGVLLADIVVDGKRLKPPVYDMPPEPKQRPREIEAQAPEPQQYQQRPVNGHQFPYNRGFSGGSSDRYGDRDRSFGSDSRQERYQR